MIALPKDPDTVDYLNEVLDVKEGLFSFKPRPDQPARYDEQSGFFYSKDPGMSILRGGNGSGTTVTMCAKLMKLLLCDEPPVRFDTPVAVVGVGYEQVCEIIFKEKLLGDKLLPKCEIEEDRISWMRPRQLWPFKVPLKPWPGRPGKNYVLEFLSADAPMNRFSGRAWGAIAICEPIPWPIVMELYRGMREILGQGGKYSGGRHNGAGRMMYEFTPIDPAVTQELEAMEDNDKLPEGWRIYRCNTRCALEAGHVSKEWFSQFFGMTSEEMQDTRMFGAYASYKGLIYQSFNRAVHLVTGVEIPRGVFHYRAVDWGASEENALCVLWGYRDSLGTWYIYDEYYSTRQDWTWEQHAAAIHAKDGLELEYDGDRYRVRPLNGHARWRHGNDPHFSSVFAPPDRPDLFREFGKYQLPCASASCGPGSVLDGIETVRKLLKVDQATQQPRLFIDKDRCPNLARQIQTYRWLVSATNGANPTDARPMPLKKDDHSCDALRYMLHSVERGDSDEAIAVWAEREVQESVRLRKPVGSRSKMKAD